MANRQSALRACIYSELDFNLSLLEKAICSELHPIQMLSFRVLSIFHEQQVCRRVQYLNLISAVVVVAVESPTAAGFSLYVN